VDYDFTANMEDQLDDISRGEKAWVPVMEQFWQPFHELVEEKMDNVQRSDVLQAREIGTDPKSGKPVSVRMGRYGPFVQIGSRDDEDKPVFASLRPGMKMDAVTLEEALELFKLPRTLGETAEGETISCNIGRFGPYVRYGSKFVSLKKEDDPHTVTLERALELIREKQAADLARTLMDFGNGIQILKGRWGPYLTDGKNKARLPKEREPESVTLEEAQQILASIPAKTRGSKKAAAKGKNQDATTDGTEAEAPKPPPKKRSTKTKSADGTPKPTSGKRAAPKAAGTKAAARTTRTNGGTAANSHKKADTSNRRSRGKNAGPPAEL
ncbi:MAG TPA: topoisomerase C-terminal repeat-containing protein, partial [Thiolinea sp.]|nr:topoisomerase C-terminal repeat-containing protein [Thiolinea sp.]